MSPTEFSNYIKQRAMQQQLHHSHNGHGGNSSGHLGPIGPVSPARSLSPNPLSATFNGGVSANLSSAAMQDSYFYSSPNAGSTMASSVYPPHQFGRNNLFDSPNASSHFPTSGMFSNNLNGLGNGGKYSSYLEPNNFWGSANGPQQHNNSLNPIGVMSPNVGAANSNAGHLQLNGNLNAAAGNNGGIAPPQTSINSASGSNNSQDSHNAATSGSGSKLLDGMNSFYSSPGPYQHLLVAN